jgi:hypothetical protein
MKKIFNLVLSLIVEVANSLGYASANTEQIYYLGAVMKKTFNLVLSLTVALAASLGCVSANAAQTNANGASAAEAASQATQTPHSLTRREVYDHLVQAEKDGSLPMQIYGRGKIYVGG